MATTGRLGDDAADLLAEWWPWALIALGVWFLIGAVAPVGRGLVESLALPLAATSEAVVRIKFGAGELRTHVAAGGLLVDGTYTGGVAYRTDGPDHIELEQDTSYGLPWLDRRSAWDVGLSGEVPIDLRVDTGASRVVLDLADLRIRNLELHTGASETRVVLPRAAGMTTVRAEAGVASLTLEIPVGVAARIRSRMALGSTQVDQARFPPAAGGYESIDFGTAPNRVDIDAQGGVGSLRVVSRG